MTEHIKHLEIIYDWNYVIYQNATRKCHRYNEYWTFNQLQCDALQARTRCINPIKIVLNPIYYHHSNQKKKIDNVAMGAEVSFILSYVCKLQYIHWDFQSNM
jgi:hypothetical protein